MRSTTDSGGTANGLALLADSHRAAVDHHLRQRLHEDVHVRRQIGDKRDVKLQMFDDVLPFQQAFVVEMYFAFVNLNVGYREALRHWPERWSTGVGAGVGPELSSRSEKLKRCSAVQTI